MVSKEKRNAVLKYVATAENLYVRDLRLNTTISESMYMHLQMKIAIKKNFEELQVAYKN